MEDRDPLAEVFRDVMSAICTPVSVVTAMDGDQPHGTTVNAFASLSLHPPMVMLALDRESKLLALIRGSGRFAVNVLGSAQPRIATTFARKGTDKFADVDWYSDHGLPRVEGASGWVACTVSRLVGGGDHVIALGTVLAAERASVPPLTYHAHEFGTHAALEANHNEHQR